MYSSPVLSCHGCALLHTARSSTGVRKTEASTMMRHQAFPTEGRLIGFLIRHPTGSSAMYFLLITGSHVMRNRADKLYAVAIAGTFTGAV